MIMIALLVETLRLLSYYIDVYIKLLIWYALVWHGDMEMARCE